MEVFVTEEFNDSLWTQATQTSHGFVFDSYPQRIFIAVVFLIVFCIGIFGNSLTILAVLLTRKLQDASNTFVINLAISDLLSCLFLPWSIVGLLIPGDWPGELSLACTIAGGMLSVSLGCSFWTLASIAIERLIIITCKRRTYYKIFNIPVLMIWVATIWIIPFSFVILPPLLGVGALGFNPKYRLCSDISEGYHPNATQTYDFIQAAGVFPIPLVILVVSYSKIVCYVRSQARELVVVTVAVSEPGIKPLGVSDETPTSSPSAIRKKGFVTVSMDSLDKISMTNGAPIKPVKRMSRRELKVTKNLFLVFCVFLVCLLPYSLCLIFDESDLFVPYAAALLLINSCINPIIYSLRFPNFKVIVKLMVKCQWHAIPEPTWLLKIFRCAFRCCSPQST